MQANIRDLEPRSCDRLAANALATAGEIAEQLLLALPNDLMQNRPEL